MKTHSFYLLALLTLFCTSVYAIAPTTQHKRSGEGKSRFRTDCAYSVSFSELNINSVRSRLSIGGDLWWDSDARSARYIVPAPPRGSGGKEVNAIYTGSVWLAGYDDVGNLRAAAQTYRSKNYFSFWPGPLDRTGYTEAGNCNNWDRLFEVAGNDIRQYITRYTQAQQEGRTLSTDEVVASILGWPGQGNPHFKGLHGFDLPDQTQGLAPFFDNDQDGIYDPLKGDYPTLQINKNCSEPVFADQMIFWIFNDSGNFPTTMMNPLRMEIQAMGFAFEGPDELSATTFQNYKMINRGFNRLQETYIALWVDPDLGCYADDYFGVDTTRSLVYIYNEDEIDGIVGCDCSGVPSYCEDIPILGIDFLQGAESYDHEGNIIDAKGLAHFTYFNNPSIGQPDHRTIDPSTALEFFRYMTGKWRDGTPLTWGGTGFDTTSTRSTNYAFPSAPDDTSSEAWSMCSATSGYADRRMIMSSGPFRLDPGSVSHLTAGVVFVPSQVYPCPDLKDLHKADDKVQALFDNCFKLEIVGPDAPDLLIEENDRVLSFTLFNKEGSNNHTEQFRAIDPAAPAGIPEQERMYRFEGYLVYQVKDPTTLPSQLNDPNRARLVFQCDISNGVSTLTNWIAHTDTQHGTWYEPQVKVTGADQGIVRSFLLENDAFNPGSPLSNGQPYYFAAVAYAYNNYAAFDESTGQGQPSPYLPSARNVRIYTALPGIRNLQADKIAEITRLDGHGNAGIYLLPTTPIDDRVLTGSFDGRIRYQKGYGPLKIQVDNAERLRRTDLEVTFLDEDGDGKVNPSTHVQVRDLSTGATFNSEKPIGEQSILRLEDYGISILLYQPDSLGQGARNPFTGKQNGAIWSRIMYSDPQGPKWLTGLIDTVERDNPLHFIKTRYNEPDNQLDPESALRKIGDAFLAPMYVMDYRFSSTSFMISPMIIDNDFGASLRSRALPANLNNVDLVFTPDRTKWSRCVVVQTASLHYNIFGFSPQDNTRMFDHRRTPSIGIDGRYATVDGTINGAPFTSASTNPNDPNYLSPVGMSWFPGYAIDVECGTRLNVFFGENSVYDEHYRNLYEDNKTIGNDMIWNPSSQLALPGQSLPLNTYLGGQHFIYLTNQPYDGCNFILGRLDPARNYLWKRDAFNYFTWAGIPMTAPGHKLLSYAEGLIPNETRIELRVNSVYSSKCGTGVNSNLPKYIIHLDTSYQTTSIAQDVQQELWQHARVNTYSGTLLLPFSPDRYTLRVFSLTGQLLHEQKGQGTLQTTSGDSMYQLDWQGSHWLGQHPCGTYIIHLDAGEYGSRAFKWLPIHKC